MMLQPPAYYTYFDASHYYPSTLTNGGVGGCSTMTIAPAAAAPSSLQAPLSTNAYTNLPTASFYYYPTPTTTLPVFPNHHQLGVNGLSFTTNSSSGPLSSSSNSSMNKVGNCSTLYYMDPNWLNTATANAGQQSCGGFQNNIFMPPTTTTTTAAVAGVAGVGAPLLTSTLPFQPQQQQQSLTNNPTTTNGWNLMNMFNYDYINATNHPSCEPTTSTTSTSTNQNVDQIDSMFNLIDPTGQFIKGLLIDKITNNISSPAIFTTTSTITGGASGGGGSVGSACGIGIGKKRKRVVYSNNILYKTILCHDFISNQNCPRGKLCQFAHGENDLHKPNHHDLYHSKLCDSMLRSGFCPRGERCFYAHNVNELKSYGNGNNSTPTPLLSS